MNCAKDCGYAERLLCEIDKLRAERDAKDAQLTACYDRMNRAELERDAYRALLLEWERCAYAPQDFARRVRATLEGQPARP